MKKFGEKIELFFEKLPAVAIKFSEEEITFLTELQSKGVFTDVEIITSETELQRALESGAMKLAVHEAVFNKLKNELNRHYYVIVI